MIKNKDITCISSIDWDFIWQGHQEIMSTFAQNGNRVLFIENTGVRTPGIRDIGRIINRIRNWFKGIKGIRKEEENLYIYSPIVLPFPYSRIARWFNRHLILSILTKWMKVTNFNDPIIWTFLPTPLSLDLIDNLSHKILIYYCIDNFSVSSVSARRIHRSEIKLIKRADLVFVTSQELYNYCSAYNKKVYIFPFAVNFEEFEKIRLKDDSTPEEIRGIRKPIIGYIGGVHKWLDLNLIKKSAEKYSDCSFVFIGPIQTDISLLSDLKNVYFLGKQDHKKIPRFIKNFDVCIIPYLITDYTNDVYPTKLNEYLAMGKPVVSTGLPEVINFNIKNDNIVSVSRTEEDFFTSIKAALDDNDKGIVNRRILVAKENSWVKRNEGMSNLISYVLEQKANIPVNWQNILSKLYRDWRKKTVSLATVLLSVYLLMFYTPLFWGIANPLKISQPAQNADCIVVFAGGVGESGKAGQGYEERVQYSVDLYNKGYAKYIIFSSGYTYVFEETQVMKALAVSLDVPQEAIVLENKAGNSYENVKFTRDILMQKGWRKILLVSSPYHMLRTSLVFKKNAKDIKVTYTPLPRSLFYFRANKVGKIIQKRISLKQIKGILHEYLGILYYWWKGWI